MDPIPLTAVTKGKFFCHLPLGAIRTSLRLVVLLHHRLNTSRKHSGVNRETIPDKTAQNLQNNIAVTTLPGSINIVPTVICAQTLLSLLQQEDLLHYQPKNPEYSQNSVFRNKSRCVVSPKSTILSQALKSKLQCLQCYCSSSLRSFHPFMQPRRSPSQIHQHR